jgi:hypothetical protein
MRSDRRTDMMNVIVAFRNFAKSTNNDNFHKPKMEAIVKLKRRVIVLQKKKNHDQVISKYVN